LCVAEGLGRGVGATMTVSRVTVTMTTVWLLGALLLVAMETGKSSHRDMLARDFRKVAMVTKPSNVH